MQDIMLKPTQTDLLCVSCRKGLEKEWDLEQVLTKAFLQVDTALASRMQMYNNGMYTQNFMAQKTHSSFMQSC